jgi:putative transposase
VKPAQKRAVVPFFRVGFRVSERRACRVAAIPWSSDRHRSAVHDQTALRLRLRELAATRVRSGDRRLPMLLRREGWRVNHQRIDRRSREEGLGIRVQRRQQRASAPRVPPPPAPRPDERWSLDVLPDSLVDGRRVRVRTIGDHVSRVSPAIEVGGSLTGERVVAVLERRKRTIGRPERIAIENGPAFISKTLDAWADQNGVRLAFSRPGKPTDNAFAASFNGRFRDECRNQHWFASLAAVRQTVEAWRIADNTQRPHRALGQPTPAAWEAAWVPALKAPGYRFRWTKPGAGQIGGAAAVVLAAARSRPMAAATHHRSWSTALFSSAC